MKRKKGEEGGTIRNVTHTHIHTHSHTHSHTHIDGTRTTDTLSSPVYEGRQQHEHDFALHNVQRCEAPRSKRGVLLRISDNIVRIMAIIRIFLEIKMTKIKTIRVITKITIVIISITIMAITITTTLIMTTPTIIHCTMMTIAVKIMT